jgi:hypothetical protein
MQSKYTTAESITPDVIKRWKVKHPDGVIEVTAGDYKAFVRMPTDGEMINVLCGNQQANSTEANKKLIAKIWLGGDMELLDNAALFAVVEPQIDRIIKAKSARSLKGIQI